MRVLRDQVVLITGASRGIGAAIAHAFAQEGCRLMLTARHPERLQHQVEALQARGVDVIGLPADVTRQEQVQRVVERTVATWGRVDILVANAGVYVQKPVVETTVEDLRRALAVNFYGGVHLVLAALPHLLRQRRGHIVLVTSMDAKKGIPPDGPYAAAKAALSAWGDVLRQELRASGIRVTIVFPGRVDTDMVAHLRVPWISAKIPPERVARAIVRAVRRGQVEVIVPWHARLLWWAQAFWPPLADWAVRFFRLSGEPIPKQEEGP